MERRHLLLGGMAAFAMPGFGAKLPDGTMDEKKAKRTKEPVQFGDAEALIARWHPVVAGMAFRRWGLPEALDEPVTCHHEYLAAKRSPRMTAVVYLANRLSHRYGFGCEPDGYDPLQDPVVELLGLDAGWFADLDAKAPGLYSVARQTLA